MKKSTFFLVTSVLLLSLSGCSTEKNQKTTFHEDNYALQSSAKTEHEDVRLNFNKIKVASVANQFKGGTSLAELTAMYGEPSQHEKVPAGDVTLDSYTWQFDQITVSAQLFEDSTIARAISNFIFVRKNTITLKKYEQLKNDMSYQDAVNLLGEPDDLSQSSSSDGEEIQAVWVSGIKTKSEANPTINLIFTDNKLTSKTQNGMK